MYERSENSITFTLCLRPGSRAAASIRSGSRQQHFFRRKEKCSKICCQKGFCSSLVFFDAYIYGVERVSVQIVS